MQKEGIMKYAIKVNDVKQNEKIGNLRGFATLVLGDSFKISNIAILEGNEGKLFVSMPRYKSNEKNEQGENVYKDVCHPITKEFREELYENILIAFSTVKEHEKEIEIKIKGSDAMPQFSISVTPFEREGSNIRGLARIYIEDSFIINNVTILQGKDNNVFVTMPSYKSKQMDENNKSVYQDVCYPVTKEFRERLYSDVLRSYQEAKEKVMGEKEKESSFKKENDKDESNVVISKRKTRL